MVSKCFTNRFLVLRKGGFDFFRTDLLSPVCPGVYNQLFPSTEGFLSGRTGTCLTSVLFGVLCGLLAKQGPEWLVYGGWRKAIWKSCVAIVDSSQMGRKSP